MIQPQEGREMEGYIERIEVLLQSRDGIEYDPEFEDALYEVVD